MPVFFHPVMEEQSHRDNASRSPQFFRVDGKEAACIGIKASPLAIKGILRHH